MYSTFIQTSFDYACNSQFLVLQKEIKNKLQVCQNKLCSGLPQQASLFLRFQQSWLVKCPQQSRLSNTQRHVWGLLILNHHIYVIQIVSHPHVAVTILLPYQMLKLKALILLSLWGYVLLWNNLPVYIKSSETKENLKRKCKMFSMNRMDQTESSEFIQACL